MTCDQITSIIEYFNHQTEFFIWQSEHADENMNENDRAQEYYESVIIPDVIDNDQDYEKILALMEHADYDWNQAESEMGSNFKVLTDDEATKAFDDSVESSVDDVIAELPDHLQRYFDREEYIYDNFNDRGAQLNYYDGQEHEVTINGTTYYIYEQ